MYTDFFHLREEPFQVTPNPKFLFLSNIHKEAIQKLVDGIRRRKGFIELVGMAGTGKTLLCKELVQMLSPEMDIAYLYYPVLSEQALYYAILKQWGVEVSEASTIPALLEKISSFLRERFEKGRNALIIIDEAQNLSIPLLENLRLLSNLETESEKLLQILLSGQPEFHELLKSGKIPQLDQRIRVRVFLKPLDKETLPLYIYHRLNMAGSGNAVSFTNDALGLIYRSSGGIPRMINAICERSLEEAASRRANEVEPSIVQVAREGLEGGKFPVKMGKKIPSGRTGRFVRVFVILLFFIFLAGGAAWIAREHFSQPVKDVKRLPPVAPVKVSKKAPPPVVKVKEEEKVPEEKPVPLRMLPLKVMESFLYGMLAVPEGRHLYWGVLRLAKRDLKDFRTPILLHVSREDGETGWICIRLAGGKGFQVWSQGDWRTTGDRIFSDWTGRCGVPYWMVSILEGHALRKGMRGASVTDLQTWLLNLGSLGQVTGIFDSPTEMAVKNFQIRQGLTPDGVAGAQTLALLFQKGSGKN
jgi:general secretion pathway protein A